MAKAHTPGVMLELDGKQKRAKLNIHKKHRAHSRDRESDEEEWLTHTALQMYTHTGLCLRYA